MTPAAADLTLRGTFTALITPMTDDGAVDYDGFRRLIRLQIEAGVDGLVPLGTTGETPTLDEAERDALLAAAVEEAGGRVPVIAGAGSNDTRRTAAAVARARALGADAALVVTPYYNKPNDSGLLAHFEAASQAGLPLVIYNIASRTGRNIPVDLLEAIARIPNVVGVKEASGDLGQITDVLARIPPPFVVLSGDDGLTLPVMALGGAGVISVVSNLVPRRVKALTDACLAGDFGAARRAHAALLPLVRAAFIETNPAPIKRAMTLAGLPGGPTRLPLGLMTPAHEEVLRGVVERALREPAP